MVEYFRVAGPNIPETLGPAGLKSNPDQKRLKYLVGYKNSPAGPNFTRTEYFVTEQLLSNSVRIYNC